MVQRKPIIIAVMGVTGTGKSSLIQSLTGRDTGVGTKLKSETSEVQAYQMELDGRTIELLDTPGFDDTEKDDTETLQTILTWLKLSDRKSTYLSGIIYLHRITDDRFTGSMVTNFQMMMELCGDKSFKNVMLVSSRWENVPPNEMENKKRQERDELKGKYWKLMISGGAKTERYDGQKKSGLAIIRRILKENVPMEVKVQKELRAPGASIASTGAGKVVIQKSKSSEGKHADTIESMRSTIESLMQTALKHIAVEQQESLKRMQALYEQQRENIDNFWKSHTEVLQDKITVLEDRIARSRRSCTIM
ncbi:P-loop containing nucleoside triphosphate hydrolase protein [Geopyxis carbonaria]|nr:P-loop containing nucleoside triphosphate hydrolase protein [Geopyxis carbonaria]